MPERGEITYLEVTLDNGKVVKVKKPNSVLYKKNERFKLIETKTSKLGNIRYDFQKYLNEK